MNRAAERAPPMKHKRLIILIAKLLVTTTLLALVYRKLSLLDLSQTLANIRPWPVLCFMALLVVNTILSAVKWRLFLKADGIDAPVQRLAVSYLIGSFFNMFMPSTIGGDAYRVAVEGRGGQLAKSFSSVFADRLSGFVALTGMGLAAALIGLRLVPQTGVIWIPATLCLGFLLIALLVMNRAWAEVLLRLTRINKIERVWRPISKCLASFDLYKKQPGLIWRIMALSFVFQTLLVICIWLLARALNINVPIINFFIFVPLISILEAVPISIYGIGLRDIGYKAMFTQAGLASPEALTASMTALYLACTALYASLGGALFLYRMFVAKRSKKRGL